MAEDVENEAKDIEKLVAGALKNPSKMDKVLDGLASDKRRDRTQASRVVEQVSLVDPSVLEGHVPALIDALESHEAKTRCALFAALSNLVPCAPKKLGDAIPAAEASLYDEMSGPVRLLAFQFLTAFGGSSVANSKKVWPLIDEALQCYHGDSEFDYMMEATLKFAQGKLDKGVASGLKERMKFDSENAKGQLGRRAKEIVEACG